MKRHAAVLLILFALSGEALATSVCRAGEEAYFRCSFSGKIAVLCGATDRATGGKLLQYRITKGRRTEMQFPNSPEAPDSRFLQSSILLAHGGEMRVSFSVGEYKYVLYETWDTRSPSYGGIYVVRKGKLVRQNQCDDYTDPQASLFESRINKLLKQEDFVDFSVPKNDG
ncbi:MAG: hypothetical protein ACM3Y9_08315 [Ignavibacteria bacterium]